MSRASVLRARAQELIDEAERLEGDLFSEFKFSNGAFMTAENPDHDGTVKITIDGWWFTPDSLEELVDRLNLISDVIEDEE